LRTAFSLCNCKRIRLCSPHQHVRVSRTTLDVYSLYFPLYSSLCVDGSGKSRASHQKYTRFRARRLRRTMNEHTHARLRDSIGSIWRTHVRLRIKNASIIAANWPYTSPDGRPPCRLAAPVFTLFFIIPWCSVDFFFIVDFICAARRLCSRASLRVRSQTRGSIRAVLWKLQSSYTIISIYSRNRYGSSFEESICVFSA
jgi:hypothetical protein